MDIFSTTERKTFQLDNLRAEMEQEKYIELLNVKINSNIFK